LIWQDQPLFASKFVSGGWDYFNNGGSLTFPAPQYVSGRWDNRVMRSKLASALVVIGLLASSMAPANGIFGLSKCEKVKKQITNEEKVGLLLHKKYSTQRQIVLAMDNPTWNDLNNAHSYLPDFIDSDLRIFSLVDKNSSCFTTQQIAKARRETSFAKQNIKDISFMRDYILKNPRLGKKVLGVETIELLRNLYPNYYSYFNNKKLG
jgi:hypothetical protein